MISSPSHVSPCNPHWAMSVAIEISNSQQELDIISSGSGLADCTATTLELELVLEASGR